MLKKLFLTISSIVIIFSLDSFLLDLLIKSKYYEWLSSLIEKTIYIYKNPTFFNFLETILMDMVGIISFFSMLYMMFDTIPNVITCVMGLDIGDKNTQEE